MSSFDFSMDELSASLEAKEKNYEIQADNETVRKIKFELEKLLNNRLQINSKAIALAFKGFEEYLSMPDINNIKIIIPNIEKSIKNDLMMKPCTDINCKDGIWVLYLYYDLFLINVIKKRKYAAVRYVYKTFLVDSRIASNDLFPCVFFKYFEPKFISKLIKKIYALPEDPRNYMKDKVTYPAIYEYSNRFVEDKIKLELFVNEECYKIAKRSIENIYTYNKILSILSL